MLILWGFYAPRHVNSENPGFEDFSKCQKYLQELLSRYGDIDRLKNNRNVMKEIEESYCK